MKRRVLLSLVSFLPLCAADARMTPEERTKLINWLEESRQEFLTAIDGLTREQWTWKAAPERWSVAETAEHIVLAEASLFANARKAMAAPANAAWEDQTRGKTELIERIMAPRLGKADAPAPLVPKGELTPAQVRERFERQRARIAAFATEAQSALEEHTAEHPFPVFGILNAYQWIIYIPLHTMRHDKQIAEVKATAGYPK